MLQVLQIIATNSRDLLSNFKMVDDRALVSRVVSGDMQAFHALIKKHERLVGHMVGRLVSQSEDREEICQDVFLKVYEKIGDFNFQSQLSTWIATIAYRHAINHLRKKKMLFSDLPEHDEHTFVSDIKADDLAEEDLEQHVIAMIEQLPAQYKIVITLYHLEQKNYTEIGEITGMPEGTVKNYLFRARQLLKEKVKKYLGKEEWI